MYRYTHNICVIKHYVTKTWLITTLTNLLICCALFPYPLLVCDFDFHPGNTQMCNFMYCCSAIDFSVITCMCNVNVFRIWPLHCKLFRGSILQNAAYFGPGPANFKHLGRPTEVTGTAHVLKLVLKCFA